MPTPFDCANPSVRAARQILLDKIAQDSPDRRQIDHNGSSYDPFVEYVGQRNPGILAFTAQEAFWQLVVEGILAPGMNSANMNLPWFHVTECGRTSAAAS